MKLRYLLVPALAVAGLAVLGSQSLLSAAIWEDFITTKRVEANPDKEYKLTKDNGPWMILASTFSGDGARQQARELVLELRKRYKLKAFIHQMEFDLDENVGKGIDRYGDPLKFKYRQHSQIKEIAVLIGDYPSVDDPEAEKVLQKIKHSTPDCLKLSKDKKNNQSLGALRDIQKTIWKTVGSDDKKDKGPMGHAFIAPNPLLSKDEYVPKGLEPFIVKLNKGLENSLLDCPGLYTVQVATFTGKVVTDQAEISLLNSGKKKIDGNRLEEAAKNANNLAKALRLKGWEAYVFHERCASIVTVGSFNSVGTKRNDGRIEMDPRVHRIIEQFKAKTVGGHFSPQMLVGIPFDVQPRPVKVPKESIGIASNEKSRGLW
ncbi:MAG: hypothetical protein JXM70_18665 [Pirellulales bacterium]|nr:hypothetical protein [Pirellulales bacterium]